MIEIRIRDNRDVRGPLCGNVKIDENRYTSAAPYTLRTMGDERWIEYFAARLLGAFTTMGELR